VTSATPLARRAGQPLVVCLSDVSVRYRVPTEPVRTLKEHAIRMLKGHRLGYREFMAIEGLSLEVPSGESLGIIGRNGAGKSTLLKVISRIIRPTTGRAQVIGRLAPLIELGAGFHAELTGRENVFLNGAMLGYSRSEMEEKFEQIVNFAELWDFIDAPLRTYSSGMKMRLGFAVATDVQPDILIIDEILSVGDQSFQEKCLARMSSFRQQGITILFVTHGLERLASICSRAIWLEAGRIEREGPVDEVIDEYLSTVSAGLNDGRRARAS
jgi:lipopolysaccharide transport system ATP-binding protein